MTVIFAVYFVIIITTVNAGDADRNEQEDGFYSYVSNKGISIAQISENIYRISHFLWKCDIDTSIAKKFRKRNISWKDLFETNIEVLSKKTKFSPDALRKKMGVLPIDGAPITLVARQGKASIPKENVVIRLNNHGQLDARTTMIMTFASNVRSLTQCASMQRKDEIVQWFHKENNNGLWNTSQPLVVPEVVWKLRGLKYYRGPLFFMKGDYVFGNFSNCTPRDGIGLGAINRVAHLKGDITTLGFSTGPDDYNMAFFNRFKLLAHKLAWSYFAVKELTDKL